MRFGERLQKLDSRLIYAVMILVIAIPLIKPIGFPVKLSREAKAAFETIDAVAPGETVLIATSFSQALKLNLSLRLLLCYDILSASRLRWLSHLVTRKHLDMWTDTLAF
jgi:hypothetical protein